MRVMLKTYHSLILRLIYAITSVLLNTFFLCLFRIVSHFKEWNDYKDKYYKDGHIMSLVIISILILTCVCLVIWIQAKYGSGNKIANNTFSHTFLKQSRRKLLNTVREDIESRIRKTLPKQRLMHLGIKQDTENLSIKNSTYIECFWNFIETDDVSSEYKKIIEVFNRANRRLLILGCPGAGKTTMLLKLGEYLIKEANEKQNEPIPVVFDMATWYPEQEISNWLISRLKIKYNLPQKLAEEWLNDYHILPLLDSLDQQQENQTQCINAINRFLRQDERNSLVICCRYEEYDKSESRLLLTTAVIEKIETYLNNSEHQGFLKKLINDENLIEFINNPLKFKLFMEVDLKIEDIKTFESSFFKEREQLYLYEFFNTYINKNLQENKFKKYQNDIEQTKKWLAWLANALQQNKQKEFLIEKIQPSWLENSQQKTLYRRYFGIISAVIFGSIFAMISGLISELFDGNYKDYMVGLVTSVTSMLISVLIYGDINEVFLVDELKLSWFKIGGFWKNRVELMLWTLFAAFASQPLYSRLCGEEKNGLIFLTISWFTTVMLNALFSINYDEIKSQKYPNQGIIDSADTASFVMIISTPFFILIYIVLGFYLKSGLNNLAFKAIIFGLCFGLFFGLVFGGIAVIQHLIIRYILWYNGNIPWNYSRFLEEMAEKEIILQIGGRYSFIHELLREHFTKI